jgi:hypothetical protein
MSVEELKAKYQQQAKELEALELRLFKLRNEMTVIGARIAIAQKRAQLTLVSTPNEQ